MSDHRVLVTDYAWPDLSVETEVLSTANADIVVASTDDALMVEQAASVDAILTCWRTVPVAALEEATGCRIVSRYGIGLDNIPVARATELGIVVTNVPDYCLDEVSDHTLGLLLACARRIVDYASAWRNGEWRLAIGSGMRRLRGQTLGIVGYGNIGRMVARKARVLGLEILVYTPRIDAGKIEEHVTAVGDLGELLAQSDYVTLHAPLNDDSRQLINSDALRQMKPTAYLINTARGALVDESALAQALHEGWIAGAALDVLVEEPPDTDNELWAAPNCIVTPHAAFFSQDSIAELSRRAAEHVALALTGKLPPQIVNPSVLERANCRFVPAE